MPREPLLWVAVGFLAVRIICALAVIPPWQNPDEPAQVAYAEYSRSALSSTPHPDPAREVEILESMAHYNWWPYYGQATPSPLPVILDAAGETAGVNPADPDQPRLYYRIVSAVLPFDRSRPVTWDLYWMRFFSSALSLVTVWVAWKAASECLGDAGGGTVAALLALHPQFGLVSATASPDAVVNLAATTLWWQGMRAVRGVRPAWSLTYAWVAAAFAAIADRMGIPLLAMACLLTVTASAREGFGRRTKVVAAVAVTGLAGSVALLGALKAFRGSMWSQILPVPAARSWEFFSTFTSFLFESWWLSVGWLRYSPPAWWLAAVAVFSVAAAVGVLRRWREPDEDVRAVIGAAFMLVAVQTAGVYWIYLRLAHGSQGRHLFPTIVPALILMWLGVESFVSPANRMYAAIALVSGFALLDMTAWMLVTLPTYAG